jgi:hypothetical protein
MSDQATQIITIDGKNYSRDSLSEAVKSHLFNVQTVDRKIADLQQEIAIMQTARAAYAKELKNALDKEQPLN